MMRRLVPLDGTDEFPEIEGIQSLGKKVSSIKLKGSIDPWLLEEWLEQNGLVLVEYSDELFESLSARPSMGVAFVFTEDERQGLIGGAAIEVVAESLDENPKYKKERRRYNTTDLFCCKVCAFVVRDILEK